MLQVIAYTSAVSAALSLVVLCEEKLALMLGMSRRFVWIATMVLSILLPLVLMLRAEPLVVAGPVGMQLEAPQPGAGMQRPDAAIALAATRDVQPVAAAAESATWMPATRKVRSPSERSLLLMWAIASGVLLAWLHGTQFLLVSRAARWRREAVLGHEVRVSETTGPALLGVWRPLVVVPRWLLDEPAATQALILEHERQHIAARDPLLLRVAHLIVVLVPWNLPLWWQLRRLRQAIELDCDARVLRTGARASAYGQVLLAVTQRAGSMPIGAIAMGEPASALERRIQQLTQGAARFSVPQALAAVVFWGVGVGAAFALDAPALLRSAARTPAMAAASEVAPRAQVPAIQAVPAAAPMLAAARAQSPSRINTAPSATSAVAAPALPRLLPPGGYSLAPRGYDDPRSRERTGELVLNAIQARADVKAAINAEAVINTERVITVFMTEDGRIDRFRMSNDRQPLHNMGFGNGSTTGLGGIVPELQASLWQPLGLRPDQLGQMGFTFLQEGGRDLIVHYAWPRRRGEPLGGDIPNDGQAFRASFAEADVHAVVEHYLPGAFKDAASREGGVPWLLLDPQGEVVKSGYAPSSLPLVVIAKANPGARVDYYMSVMVKGNAGENPPDQVVLGWLAEAFTGE